MNNKAKNFLPVFTIALVIFFLKFVFVILSSVQKLAMTPFICLIIIFSPIFVKYFAGVGSFAGVHSNSVKRLILLLLIGLMLVIVSSLKYILFFKNIAWTKPRYTFLKINKDEVKKYWEPFEYINSNIPPNSIIAAKDIGKLSYSTKNHILDLSGIVNPEVISFIKNKNLDSYISQKKSRLYYPLS